MADPRYSVEDAEEFTNFAQKRGLVPTNTAKAWRSTLTKLASVMDDGEKKDIRSIDIEGLMTRFGHLHASNFAPSSLRTYGSRLTALVSEFVKWKENPAAYSYRTTTTPRAKKDQTPSPDAKNKDAASSEAPKTPVASQDTFVLPIPIRSDCFVEVRGLPVDLSEEEAEKIAGIIKAYSKKR
jgi:hypothetical protein